MGFDKIIGPDDVLAKRDANRARRALGVATRRELVSTSFWIDLLRINDAELESLLAPLGRSAYDGGRLRKRAINRLKSEGRSRNVWPLRPEGRGKDQPVTPEWPPFEWEVIGHIRQLRQLTPEHIVAIHQELVRDFAASDDPIVPSGVRSQQLLESATYRPRTSLQGLPKYSTVEMAAAALLHSIVHDHPFHNGNKRTALVAMLVLLDHNGIALTCHEDPLFKLVLQLAQHALVTGPTHELADREVISVAKWLREHSRWVEKGDRAIPWRRLQQILVNYGCQFEFNGGGSNHTNVTRKVLRRGSFLTRSRYETLLTHAYYADSGADILPSLINRIRHDLELDDEHGVDSGTFYDNAPATPSDFIVRYRKTIRRLARV